MIAEHAHAVITRDLPELGLVTGDVGVVVHVHAENGKHTGYMLEIFSVDGESVGEISVPLDAVRAASASDRLHARSIAAE